MISAKQDRLAAIHANMDAKQKVINDIDRKIKRTNELIEKTRGRNLSTEAFESQLAGYLRSREYMRVEWNKLMDEARALSKTDGQ